MTRALAYARHLSVDSVEVARAAIVAVSALTLIAAGQALPF